MTFWGKRRVLIAASALMLVAVAALVSWMALSPRTPPAAVEGVQEKAEAFGKTVEADLQAQKDATAEARLVRLSFPKDRPLSVFFAGDSLGVGFYSSVQSMSYRPLVTAELEKFGKVEHVRATKPASAPLFQVGNAESIPASGIDLAIVELGTNDAGRTEIKLFAQQYESLISKIQAGSPDVYIICAGAWGYPGSLTTDPYDKEIRSVCEKHGGKYVDLTDAFMTKGSFGPAGVDTWAGKSDNFHPNDKGHRAIADLIMERIKVS